MQSEGVPVKALENQPKLIRRWEYAKEIFEELSGSRRYTSGGAANIPFSEYDRYAKAYNFDQTELAEYWEELRIVDDIWLQEVAKNQKNAEAQAKKGK